MNKRLFILVMLCFFAGCDFKPAEKETAVIKFSLQSDDQKIAEAFERQISNIWVESKGTIEKVLADDREGSPHQRLIVRLSTGQTLLLSHNIDIAPRVPDPQIGTEIYFRGEYEWNAKGGVVHWTHRDPSNRHPGGWLEYKGRKYR